jgi:hypothetical protein
VIDLFRRAVAWLGTLERTFFAAPKEQHMTVDEAVARYIEILESYVGVGAFSARPRFISIFCPPFDSGEANFFATPDVKDVANSTCGVFQIAALVHLLEELGLLDLAPELRGTIGGDWWGRATAAAKRLGALRTAHDGLPGLACIVYVAVYVGMVAHQHWYGIVEDRGSGHVTSVDGGSVEKDERGRQFQAIARCERVLRPGFDETAQKPIVMWLDVRAMLGKLLEAA